MSERYQPTESREARAERRAAQLRWGFEQSDYRENHEVIQGSSDVQPATTAMPAQVEPAQRIEIETGKGGV